MAESFTNHCSSQNITEMSTLSEALIYVKLNATTQYVVLLLYYYLQFLVQNLSVLV